MAISHVCALHDISETGARLNVEGSETVPDHFILLLSANGAARRYCRVVWRQPRQIGVHFEPHPPATERARLVPALDPDLPPRSRPRIQPSRSDDLGRGQIAAKPRRTGGLSRLGPQAC